MTSTSNENRVEVVVTSVGSALVAEKAGADRIELCSALSVGGITPSIGLLAEVKDAVRIPVHVLIRPREGDFVYSNSNINTMLSNIELCALHGIDGIVVGPLQSNGKVNVDQLKTLVKATNSLKVTFHRAIDLCKNPLEELEKIIDCGCDTVLTSGGKKTAIEGVKLIHQLAEKSNGRISIMPGSGISIDNIDALKHPLIHEYHLSGSVIIKSAMPSQLFEMDHFETSEEKVKAVVERLKMKI